MGPIQSNIIGESIANAVKENKDEVRYSIFLHKIRNMIIINTVSNYFVLEYYALPMRNLSSTG